MRAVAGKAHVAARERLTTLVHGEKRRTVAGEDEKAAKHSRLGAGDTSYKTLGAAGPDVDADWAKGATPATGDYGSRDELISALRSTPARRPERDHGAYGCGLAAGKRSPAAGRDGGGDGKAGEDPEAGEDSEAAEERQRPGSARKRRRLHGDGASSSAAIHVAHAHFGGTEYGSRAELLRALRGTGHKREDDKIGDG